MRRNLLRRISTPTAWGWEQLEASGKTKLEESYATSAETFRKVFNEPLPELPQDGNNSPQFLIGFANYNHRLRDQYKTVIATKLALSASVVSLSIGWSGRANLQAFQNVQKVCGVQVRLEDEEKTISERVRSFVELVESKKDLDLLSLRMTRASVFVPINDNVETSNSVSSLTHPALSAALEDLTRAYQCIIFVADHQELSEIEPQVLKIFHQRKVIPKFITFEEARSTCGCSSSEELRQVLSCLSGSSISPYVFIGGHYVGSIPQLFYLHKNKRVLDAVISQPSNLELKQKRKS